jgi:hypothetical protein
LGEFVAPVAKAPLETDEEVMTRIGERFDILDQMTKATIAGDVRAMIVVGPPGVGKSYGVEKQLEHSGLFDKLSGSQDQVRSDQRCHDSDWPVLHSIQTF